MTGLELIRAVARTDCNCKRVDTRSLREFFYFVRGSELRVSRVNVYVVFDTCEFTKFRFNDYAVVKIFAGRSALALSGLIYH